VLTGRVARRYAITYGAFDRTSSPQQGRSPNAQLSMDRQETPVFTWGKRNTEPTAAQKQIRLIIRSRTADLVRVANRAEPLSKKLAEAEATDRQERDATRALIATQNQLLDAIVEGVTKGLSLEHIVNEAIQPVLESSVVSDLAAFSIDTALDAAQARLRANNIAQPAQVR